MRAAKVLGLTGLLLTLPSPPSTAQLTTLETEAIRVIYLEPVQSGLGPYAARALENSLATHRRIFGYEPWEKVTLLLRDLRDVGGAGATPVPRDLIFVDIAPKSFAYETYPANERVNTYMNHEMVHLVATDMAAKRDRIFRKCFLGKVPETSDHPETILYGYLTHPRYDAPRWYQEGAAVFVETWMAGGIGRAQGSFDEMVFRAKVRDDSLIYDPLGLASEGTKTDFQLEANSYLYGTRFLTWLAYEHSPEKLVEWISRKDGSEAYYARQFRAVYGRSIKEAWDEWIAWERPFQQANLEAVRAYPVTPYRDLSPHALGDVSRAFLDQETGRIYAAFNYPGVVAHVGAIPLDGSPLERIREIKGPVGYTVASLAWDPEARRLYYTTDNAAYRDLVVLDPATGKSRVLLKDARIGDLALDHSDGALWGIRHFNGLATLVRIPRPYDQWEQVHTWPYGVIAYDLDVSPDGRLLSVSVGEINGRHALHVFETARLLQGEAQAVSQVDFGTTIPSNFVFSPDARFLYGSSYYTGVSNIFRYEIATEDLQAVSNTETGLFRPLPLGGDRLMVFRYTGEGFVPAEMEALPLEDVSAITFLGERLVDRHPVVTEWVAGSPASVDLASRVTSRRPYNSFAGIRLESAYPIIQGYKEVAALGYHLDFSDPLAVNRFGLTASYSPHEGLNETERPHLELTFERYNWRGFARLNAADFYDLFGPTKTGRKGTAFGGGYRKTLLLDQPRRLDLSVGAAAYNHLDRLPDYQNVEATFDELVTSNARLSFSNLRASLGAVDYEKGLSAEGILSLDVVNDEWLRGLVLNFDVGTPLPLKHSSLWLRTSVGGRSGDPDNPFANIFFGGFGNNYVDHGSVQRYRSFTSFPGVELNAVGGRNFAKAMVDWNLPPIIFRKVGTPGFYLTLARSSLFVGGIRTNLDEDLLRRELLDVGGQIDFRFTTLHRLEMTLSFGYAVAFESGEPDSDEIMISLKILR